MSEAITIGYLYDLILLPGAMFYWDSQKYYYLLADESSNLSSDGKTFTYKVRSGLSWSDGKPITAQDVYTTWVLRYVNQHAAFTYVDGFEKTDDMTVTFHIKQPAPIVQYWLLREHIVSDAVYGKWAKQGEPMVKAHTAGTDKAMTKLANTVASFKPKNVVASGPFTFDPSSVTNSQLTLVQNPKGYKAKDIHFNKVVVYNGETEIVTPLVLAKKVDYATHGFPVATEKQFKQEGFRILRPPVYSGPALYMNFAKHPEFADKKVRQALTYAIDQAQVGKAALGESGKDINLNAGISDLEVPKFMSSDEQAKLTKYELDVAKATSMLTAAGWKKSGGKWSTPGGKPAKYDLAFVSQFADWTGAAQNLATQLNGFGFQITLRGIDETQEPVDVDNGHFDLALQGWGSSSNPYPSDSFTLAFITHNYPTVKPKKGIDFPLKQHTDVAGEVDLETLVPDSATGSFDELKAKISKLCMIFNELLPIIPLYDRYGNNPVLTSDITGFPEDDNDPIYKNSVYADNFVTILMYDGKLAPA